MSLNAFAIGLVVGVGEFLGYALRLVTGYLSDRTRSYWFFTFLGYGLLVSVPLLSLTNLWQTAAILIVLERAGKAVRNPARDTILSHASSQVGTGFGFGLHEALDQIGAVAGPLIFAVFFAMSAQGKGIAEYQKGYELLWLPFLALMVFLFLAFLNLKDTEKLETETVPADEPKRFSRVFWLYCVFIFITTLGFANFMLLGYHFKATGILSDAQIPLFLGSALLGFCYDRSLTALIVLATAAQVCAIPVFMMIRKESSRSA